MPSEDYDVKVTAGDRTLSCVLCGAGILVVLINMFIISNQKILMALIALVLLLLFFFFYNINFIDLWISGNKIVMRKFNRQIAYSKILKLTVLPITAKRVKSFSTILLIVYENAAGRKTRKFVEVPVDKRSLLEEVKRHTELV
jgi:hypothetical protein